MTISQWLVDAMIKLKEAEVPNGRTDALVLLCDEFQVDKSWVHTHPEKIIENDKLEKLTAKLEQRLNRIPLAYIRGFIEFYGRNFTVTPEVLIPRPESESFINMLKELDLNPNTKIADIGTGSGCLGISAALEISGAQVDLYDISPEALKVARTNSQKLNANVNLHNSDLLNNLVDDYDILLANLPYVPESLITSPEIRTEPEVALFSGEEGLNHYRDFWQQVSQLKNKPQYILIESLQPQIDAISQIADGYTLEKVDILVSLYRNNEN